MGACRCCKVYRHYRKDKAGRSRAGRKQTASHRIESRKRLGLSASSIAAQYCEVLYRTAGFPVLITDRDHMVAVSGISRREVLERRVSHGLEDQIENRRIFSAGDGQPLQPIEGVAYYALVQSPIISSGDVCGSVMFLQNKENDRPGEAEQKLIAAAASYLGKQMEL